MSFPVLDMKVKTCFIDLIISSALSRDEENYMVVGEANLNEYIGERFEAIAKRRLNAEYVDLNPGIEDPIFISDIHKLKSTWTRSYSLDSLIEQVIRSNLYGLSTMNTNNKNNSFSSKPE